MPGPASVFSHVLASAQQLVYTFEGAAKGLSSPNLSCGLPLEVP